MFFTIYDYIIMCSILSLGAINKNTKEYVYPLIANKIDKYICPECNKDVIIRKGDIRVHHFAHIKDDNPCNYYDKPTEAQIHKDAKILLKTILDDKKQIVIERECLGIMNTYNCPFTNGSEEYEIPVLSNTSSIHIEYRFEYNGLKVADVAYMHNNDIVCLFEIYNKHRTDEQNRPEPWFELDARDLITITNSDCDIYKLKCIRKFHCDDCKDALTIIKCARCKEPTRKLKTSVSLVIKDTFNLVCIPCKQFEREQVWLNIPYSEKDIFKQYGGKWDEISKKWYIHNSNTNRNIILKRWRSII